jgi:hypothetical protein
MSVRPINIIQCEHDREFTVITNKLLSDKRLTLDEKGLLCWFLSLPKDWEIRPAHVCKEHDIGRDRYHRIMKSLRDRGYSKMVVERAEDGTIVCIRHLVAETPKFQHEVPDDPDERVCEIENAEIEAIDDTVAPLQQPGYPDTAEPCTANPVQEKRNKESPNTDSTKAIGGVWSDLQKAWPPDDVLSVLVCEKLFAFLSLSDRKQAVEAAKPYIANCRAKNRKLCDLSTYLKERRFVGKLALPPSALPIIRPGTPQAARWLEYFKATRAISYARTALERNQAVTLETEWPPALPIKNESTGPPNSDLMSPEDREELAKKWG